MITFFRIQINEETKLLDPLPQGMGIRSEDSYSILCIMYKKCFEIKYNIIF